MMESSVALGKPDLAPGSAAGLDPVPRSSGGDPGKEPQDPPNLNGCVPLSHQVAGHKFGVDKGGEWRALTGRVCGVTVLYDNMITERLQGFALLQFMNFPDIP